MEKLLSAVLLSALLAGCGIQLPEGSGEVDIHHRIPSK